MAARRFRAQLPSLWLTASLLAISGFATAQNYTAIDLGTFGGTFTAGQAINNAGQVVGTATNAEDIYRPFLWSGGTLTDLHTLSGSSAQAFGINSASQVVGQSNLAGEM